MVAGRANHLRARQEFLIKMSGVFQKIDSAFSEVAPETHTFLKEAKELTEKDHWCEQQGSRAATVLPSLTLLANRTTSKHRDTKNHPNTLECSLPTGNYTGGHFVLHGLEVSFKYPPGWS